MSKGCLVFTVSSIIFVSLQMMTLIFGVIPIVPIRAVTRVNPLLLQRRKDEN